MKRRLSVALQPPPAWQRQRLRRWLGEWQIEQRLAADQPPRESAAPARDPRAAAGWSCGAEYATGKADPAPAAGQIRLLRPDDAATRERPVFVALLSRRAGMFTVAPFGRFAEPAFEGELATERSAPALRVLCLWNLAVLPAVRLARSWWVGRLSKAERTAAAAVRRHLAGRAALAPELAQRCGPPLRHPADPRQEYRAEERFFMARLQAAAAVAPPTAAAEAWPETEAAALERAAEQRATYGSGRRPPAAPADGAAGGDASASRQGSGAGGR